MKALFRPRGAERRLAIMRELGLPAYQSVGLDEPMWEALAAMDWCRLLRNQYAHSYFGAVRGDRLLFMNLEDVARRDEVLHSLDEVTLFYEIDETLLKRQLEYFEWTGDLLYYLFLELPFRNGRRPSNDSPPPGGLERPAMYLKAALLPGVESPNRSDS